MSSEPVSLNALSQILGRSKSGLHWLEKRGHISRNSQGKFDIAEVQRAIAATVDVTKAHRRGVSSAVHKPAVRSPRSNGERMVRIDGKLVAIEQAEAERDRCLARLAELRARRE